MQGQMQERQPLGPHEASSSCGLWVRVWQLPHPRSIMHPDSNSILLSACHPASEQSPIRSFCICFFHRFLMRVQNKVQAGISARRVQANPSAK
jgi:hypothetical protein